MAFEQNKDIRTVFRNLIGRLDPGHYKDSKDQGFSSDEDMMSAFGAVADIFDRSDFSKLSRYDARYIHNLFLKTLMLGAKHGFYARDVFDFKQQLRLQKAAGHLSDFNTLAKNSAPSLKFLRFSDQLSSFLKSFQKEVGKAEKLEDVRESESLLLAAASVLGSLAYDVTQLSHNDLVRMDEGSVKTVAYDLERLMGVCRFLEIPYDDLFEPQDVQRIVDVAGGYVSAPAASAAGLSFNA